MVSRSPPMFTKSAEVDSLFQQVREKQERRCRSRVGGSLRHLHLVVP